MIFFQLYQIVSMYDLFLLNNLIAFWDTYGRVGVGRAAEGEGRVGEGSGG